MGLMVPWALGRMQPGVEVKFGDWVAPADGLLVVTSGALWARVAGWLQIMPGEAGYTTVPMYVEKGQLYKIERGDGTASAKFIAFR